MKSFTQYLTESKQSWSWKIKMAKEPTDRDMERIERHLLKYDVKNSIHVKIWRDFCKDRCKNFIDYFPIFFDEMNKSSYLDTYNKYYFRNDPHFNKEGHKVLANKLIDIFK